MRAFILTECCEPERAVGRRPAGADCRQRRNCSGACSSPHLSAGLPGTTERFHFSMSPERVLVHLHFLCVQVRRCKHFDIDVASWRYLLPDTTGPGKARQGSMLPINMLCLQYQYDILRRWLTLCPSVPLLLFALFSARCSQHPQIRSYGRCATPTSVILSSTRTHLRFSYHRCRRVASLARRPFRQTAHPLQPHRGTRLAEYQGFRAA